MDEQTTLFALGIGAVSVGVVHTLMGPDHYLPFVALSKCRKWSLAKTVLITFFCGLAHTLSSVLIGCVGMFIGVSTGVLEKIEGGRGDLVKWILLAFALAYVIYGLKRGLTWNKVHRHADGTVHSHGGGAAAHSHGLFGHSHSRDVSNDANFWIIFLIFAFGPCEALIPMVVEPASRGDWWGVLFISVVFSAATIATMLVMVCSLLLGISGFKVSGDFFPRWGSAITGLVICSCAALMFWGL